MLQPSINVDYLKLMARYTLVPDYELIKAPLTELAKMGSVEAIARYYTFKIDNKDKVIDPEIANLVDKMDGANNLMQAYCKALKSYHSIMDIANKYVTDAVLSYNLYSTIKSHPAQTTVMFDVYHTGKISHKQAKSRKNLNMFMDFERYAFAKKIYLGFEFMAIIKPAVEEFSKRTKNSFNLAFDKMSVFSSTTRTIEGDLNYVDLINYIEVLNRFDIVPKDPIFKDTKNIKKLQNKAVFAYTFPCSTYVPSDAENLALAQMIYNRQVKTRSLFWNVWAKNYLNEVAMIDYSAELQAKLNGAKVEVEQNLEEQTEATNPTSTTI